ncbi:MAG: PaaI family thioesterase [Pseudomonadota bacterium]
MNALRPPQVPDGFEPMPTRGPFTDINGPIWYLPSDGGVSTKFGLYTEERHTNALGFVHGGMLSTALDSSMARTVFERHDCRLVTLQLNTNFISAVFKGRWSEIDVQFVGETNSDVRMHAKLTSRKMVCVEADAVYRLFKSSKN